MTPLLFSVLLAAAPEPLVDLTSLVPDLIVDLRYATPDNFMKQQVYPSDAACLLLEHSARAVAKVADGLRAQGYRLKVYDCYRPHSVQYALWKIMPKIGYVADPVTGSNHNRGGAVDLTLAQLDGGVVEMPSGYDYFGPAAHHWFTGGTKTSLANRATLRTAMERGGFIRNAMEWWHYESPDAVKSPLRDEPFPSKCTTAIHEAKDIADDQRRDFAIAWLTEHHVDPASCGNSLDALTPKEISVTQGGITIAWQPVDPQETQCFTEARVGSSVIHLSRTFCFALPREIKIEDFNFDGHPDLRLVAPLSPSQSRRFDEIWLQSGKGTFTRSEALSSLDDVEVDSAKKTLTSRELDQNHISARKRWHWVKHTLTAYP